LGQGLEGAGEEETGTAGTLAEPVSVVTGEAPLGTGVPVAAHLVQMVEVEVRVTVETELVTDVMTAVPEVMVAVTGQVVTVS